jgi:hypothetical protein
MGEIRSACKTLVGKSEGRANKKSLGVVHDNIKTSLKEIEWEDVGWIYVALGKDLCLVLVNRGKEAFDSVKGEEFFMVN